MTMLVTEEEVDARAKQEILSMVKSYFGDPLGASGEMFRPKLEVLTTYMMYRSQVEASKQTRALIRWSKALTVATAVLALATVVLVVRSL